MNNDIPFTYDDIVNLEHPTSQVHPRMPISARAAQFGAFAALSGHDEAISRTATDHATHVNDANSFKDLDDIN